MAVNIAPVAPNSVIQCILVGYVTKDAPVPIGSPAEVAVVNVFNYLYVGVGVNPNPQVQLTTGIGASFYNNVFLFFKQAVNASYTARFLRVRSLTNPAFITEDYLNDGSGGHIIGGVAGQIPGEDFPLNCAATIVVPVTGGKGNNGKFRKSFGPLSATDTIIAAGPMFNRDRISLHAGDGNTGVNWAAMKNACTSSIADSNGIWNPFLFSRNQSILTPVSGPPTIRGWVFPDSPSPHLVLTIGSLKHRTERARPIG